MQISWDHWIALALLLFPPSLLTLPYFGVCNIPWKPGKAREFSCSNVSREDFTICCQQSALKKNKGKKRRKRETTVSTWGSAGSSRGVTGSPDRRLAEEPSLPSGQLLLNPGRSSWTTVCPCERERTTKAQGQICWELGSSYTCNCWDRVKYNHIDFGLTQHIFC